MGSATNLLSLGAGWPSSQRTIRSCSHVPNTKAEILAFRRTMKTLATRLHKDQIALRQRSREELAKGQPAHEAMMPSPEVAIPSGLPSSAPKQAGSDGTVNATALKK